MTPDQLSTDILKLNKPDAPARSFEDVYRIQTARLERCDLDEQHCTCVPLLRQALKDSNAARDHWAGEYAECKTSLAALIGAVKVLLKAADKIADHELNTKANFLRELLKD